MNKAVCYRCPNCNADLNVDFKRDYVFCGWCGAKLFIENGKIRYEVTQNINCEINYKHIDKNIDEARISENNSREKIELERIALKLERSKSRNRTLITIISIIVSAVLLFFLMGLLSVIYQDIKKERQLSDPNKVIMQNFAFQYKDLDYKGVVSSLDGMGFEIIETFALKDLTFDAIEEENKISSISIGGDYDFSKGDIFKKTDKVVITYHSLKEKSESGQ